MNEVEKEKIKRFMSDKVMAEAVKESILETFLKPQKDKDVQTLAASRIAIDLFQEAFKDLQRYVSQEKNGGEKVGNPGL